METMVTTKELTHTYWSIPQMKGSIEGALDIMSWNFKASVAESIRWLESTSPRIVKLNIKWYNEFSTKEFSQFSHFIELITFYYLGKLVKIDKLDKKEFQIRKRRIMIWQKKNKGNEMSHMNKEAHLTKYLVRPTDYHIFEIDFHNCCYRSYSNRSVTYPDGTRPSAQEHFTFKNLTENYDFIPIQDDELPEYEKKHELYTKNLNWDTRSDGHGGSKGGTMDKCKERFWRKCMRKIIMDFIFASICTGIINLIMKILTGSYVIYEWLFCYYLIILIGNEIVYEVRGIRRILHEKEN